jgi:iron complex outermembrane receptor protein
MKPVRYVIAALLAVLWMAPLSAQGPTGTIRGRVVDDATKEPLTGVSVTFGTRGARSQADGRFIITAAPTGTDTLRARMLGYAPAAAAVTVEEGQVALVDLTMNAQAVGLSEIVVVGYGEQRAGDITGAVSSIPSVQFNTGFIISPEQLVMSKVAGVQVVDNNEPGGGITIRIRGATSVNASSDPLYVIDGMPVGTGAGGGVTAGRNALNFLNPNDIESITVLKDASAAAIYGANAANGVVLITTKSSGGRQGTQIEYSTSASASSVTRLPSILSAAQFRAAMTAHDTARISMMGSASTNWLDLVTRTSYGQEQNVSLTTASADRFFRLSVGYLNSDGIVRGSTTERLSLGLNYDQHFLNDRLDVKANLKGSRTNDQFTPNGALGQATSMAPTQPVYDPTNTQGFNTGYWDWNTTGASASNPVAALNLATSHGTNWRSVGNVQLDYRLPWIEGLRANLNLGYDVTQGNSQSFAPGTLADQTRQGHGYLNLSNPEQMNSVLEAYLNYAAPLNFLPGNIDITGGYSYAMSHSEFPAFSEQNLGSNLLGDNGIPTAITVQNTKSIIDSKLISFFGRLNYNLADRYLVALTVRRDGSSRFGPSNAWGVFPSVSLGWRLSQEPFMRSFTVLSDLKLRGSWAKTGNQSFADYQQYATYTYGNNQAQYQFGTQFITTIRPSAVDPNIKWEATESYNAGLDFGFSNQRFSGSIDWYTKKTNDLIFTVPVPAGTNFSNFLTTNIGSMKNTGLELSLNARLLEGRGTGLSGLSWNATFTAGHNTNELVSINPIAGATQTQIRIGGIAGGVGTTALIYTPGEPINSFWMCQQAFASGKPQENKFVALVKNSAGGDSVVTGCDSRSLRAYHSAQPTWILGHTSNMTYGSFDLSFTMRAYLGNYTYNNVASSLGNYNQLSNGGSPSNMSTSVLKTNFQTPQYLSDYYVEDASFLRMDNLTLGYTLHYRGMPLRLFATVQNVFTITGYSGVDPTAGLNGLDNNIYPRSRTFTGGLSVRF